MVALFRRIRRKSSDEGLLKEYLTYAFGEALLITVGILLALQVNNWNQDRLDALEEQRLFGALSEEMELNRFRYERGKRRQDDIMGAAERLLRAVHRAEARPSVEQLNQDIQRLMGRFFVTTSSSTYDVLVGSGELGLLSSAELRKELAFLKLQMELVGTYEDIQANFIDAQLSPFLNRSVDRMSASAEALELGGQLPESRFSTSNEALLESREFSNLLVELIRHTRSVRGRYTAIEDVVSRIDSMVLGS